MNQKIISLLKWSAPGMIAALMAFVLSGCASSAAPVRPPDFRIKGVYLTSGEYGETISDVSTAARQAFPVGATDEIVAHVIYLNLSGPRNIRWEWMDPDGRVYVRTPDFTVSPPKVDLFAMEGVLRHRITIKDEPAALKPGQWTLNIHLDGVLANTSTFTLDAP